MSFSLGVSESTKDRAEDVISVTLSSRACTHTQTDVHAHTLRWEQRQEPCPLTLICPMVIRTDGSTNRKQTVWAAVSLLTTANPAVSPPPPLFKNTFSRRFQEIWKTETNTFYFSKIKIICKWIKTLKRGGCKIKQTTVCLTSTNHMWRIQISWFKKQLFKFGKLRFQQVKTSSTQW